MSTRRRFLQKAGLATVAAPMIVKASALGLNGAEASKMLGRKMRSPYRLG